MLNVDVRDRRFSEEILNFWTLSGTESELSDTQKKQTIIVQYLHGHNIESFSIQRGVRQFSEEFLSFWTNHIDGCIHGSDVIKLNRAIWWQVLS